MHAMHFEFIIFLKFLIATVWGWYTCLSFRSGKPMGEESVLLDLGPMALMYEGKIWIEVIGLWTSPYKTVFLAWNQTPVLSVSDKPYYHGELQGSVSEASALTPGSNPQVPPISPSPSALPHTRALSHAHSLSKNMNKIFKKNNPYHLCEWTRQLLLYFDKSRKMLSSLFQISYLA